ncbi:TPA: hypothetical protein ACF21D_004922 [Klebsiella quasipneumoniae subsp. similipneumoniae]
MKIDYYIEKKAEFDEVKDVIKDDIIARWGNDQDFPSNGLDRDRDFEFYFEKYQHLITSDGINSSLKNKSSSLLLDDNKLAAFFARVRNFKYGVDSKSLSGKLWVKVYSDIRVDFTNDRPKWIDSKIIEEIGIVELEFQRVGLSVTTQANNEYRVSKFSFPAELIDHAQESLIFALNTNL